MEGNSGITNHKKLSIKTIGRIKQTINKIKKVKTLKVVESLRDPETQLQEFRNKNLTLIKPELLYQTMNKSEERLVSSYREKIVTNGNNETINYLEVFTKESKIKLLNKEFRIMHIGSIIIGIKGLHRKGLGTKVYIGLVDSRINNKLQSIIGGLEIDMNENAQLAYIIPDILYPLTMIDSHLKLVVKTKGYNMTENAENVLICIGLIGKVTTSSKVNYTLEQIDMVKYLAGKGISIILAKRENPNYLAGSEWNLDDILESKTSLLP